MLKLLACFCSSLNHSTTLTNITPKNTEFLVIAPLFNRYISFSLLLKFAYVFVKCVKAWELALSMGFHWVLRSDGKCSKKRTKFTLFMKAYFYSWIMYSKFKQHKQEHNLAHQLKDTWITKIWNCSKSKQKKEKPNIRVHKFRIIFCNFEG